MWGEREENFVPGKPRIDFFLKKNEKRKKKSQAETSKAEDKENV